MGLRFLLSRKLSNLELWISYNVAILRPGSSAKPLESLRSC